MQVVDPVIKLMYPVKIALYFFWYYTVTILQPHKQLNIRLGVFPNNVYINPLMFLIEYILLITLGTFKILYSW